MLQTGHQLIIMETGGLRFPPVRSVCGKVFCQTGSQSAFVMFAPCCLVVFVVSMGLHPSISGGRRDSSQKRQPGRQLSGFIEVRGLIMLYGRSEQLYNLPQPQWDVVFCTRGLQLLCGVAVQ